MKIECGRSLKCVYCFCGFQIRSQLRDIEEEKARIEISLEQEIETKKDLEGRLSLLCTTGINVNLI